MNIRWGWLGGLTVLLSAWSVYAQPAPSMDFSTWVEHFRQEATQVGIPDPILNDAFDGINEPNDRIIALDRKQPEDTISFSDYLAGSINDSRVDKGKTLMVENAELLRQIGNYYHVQPKFIVALWGMETSYGSNKGNFSVIESVATLAYEGRRANFFRKELLNALTILMEENMQASALTGSWAGAMGNCQFMPTSYLQFAVDWDGDGHRDIWNSLPDTFASIANYLHQSGWDGSVGWGGPVTAPEGFKESEARIDMPRTLSHWVKRGITFTGSDNLPRPGMTVYAVYPGDPWEGLYLVNDNYKVLLQWNRSRYFATSVGILADRIEEQP